MHDRIRQKNSHRGIANDLIHLKYVKTLRDKFGEIADQNMIGK